MPTSSAVFQAQPSDVVLFVFGCTGAGKSQFINSVLDEIGHPEGRGMRMEVHERLSRCTLRLHPVRLAPSRGDAQDPLRSVVAVDGPGWENNEVVDRHHKIFSDAQQWLSLHYTSNPQCGVIYIQDVSSQPLVTPVVSLSLQACLDFASTIQCRHFAMATTKWRGYSRQMHAVPQVDKGQEVLPKELDDPEVLLRSRSFTWKKVLDAGFLVHRIEHDQEGRCSLSLIQRFLSRTPREQEQERSILRSKLSRSGSRPSPPVTMKIPTRKREDDVVILVTGNLKAGKSTLLNDILEGLGQTQRMRVGDSLDATTTSIASVIITSHRFQGIEGRRVTLVDTPGFQGNSLEDDLILEKIDSWLRGSFVKRKPECGVIYLHDITQEGFARTARRVFELFPMLVRHALLKQVIIATTKWDKESQETGITREAELLSKFWFQLVNQGYLVRRISRDGVRSDGTCSHLEVLGEMLRGFDGGAAS